MAEVNFGLRRELRRLDKMTREHLYARRGELPGCKRCGLRLTCFMKRLQRHIEYCPQCQGWIVEEIKAIVVCIGFKWLDNKARTQRMQNGVVQACPNCNRLSPDYQGYRFIRKHPMMDEERLEMVFANDLHRSPR